MRTLNEIVKDLTITPDQVRLEFNAYLQNYNVDIHDWEKMINHLVWWIEEAAMVKPGGNLTIIKYLQQRFRDERPFDLIDNPKKIPFAYFGKLPVKVFNPHKTHLDYNLNMAFLYAAELGHIEVLKCLAAEGELNHVDPFDYQWSCGQPAIAIAELRQFLIQQSPVKPDVANPDSKEMPSPIKGKDGKKFLTQKNYSLQLIQFLKDNAKYQADEQLDAIQAINDFTRAIRKLNHSDVITNFQTTMLEFYCAHIDKKLLPDFTAILTKIAKQRILEVEVLTMNQFLHGSIKGLPMKKAGVSIPVANFLNTNRYSFGQRHSSNWYCFGALFSTKSHDIYNVIKNDLNPQRGEKMFLAENLKLQKLLEDFTRAVGNNKSVRLHPAV